MRRGLLILGCGLIAAGLAYACFYHIGTAKSREWLNSPQPELVWLKQEYRLSDEEFARISQLHNAYLPKCAERCRRIAEMNRQLEQAFGEATEVTPAIKTLLAERADMRVMCQTEMLEHFFEVSRTMPAEQGRRYLAWVQSTTCLQEDVMAGHSEAGEMTSR